MGVYQLVGVLADIDLFRRLRARGQARAEPMASQICRRRWVWSLGSPSPDSVGAAGLGWPTVSASISTWCAPWST